jgi:hypothetical protein
MCDLARQLVIAKRAAAAADAELECAYGELAYAELKFTTAVPAAMRERMIAAAADSIRNDQIYDNASGLIEDQGRLVSALHRDCGCTTNTYENVFSGEHCCEGCINTSKYIVCPPEVSALLELEDQCKQLPYDGSMECEWRTLGPAVDADCYLCGSKAVHHFRGSRFVLCKHHYQLLFSPSVPVSNKSALAQE